MHFCCMGRGAVLGCRGSAKLHVLQVYRRLIGDGRLLVADQL